MPDVEMPDGVIVNFPDDMPKEQIRALIQTKFPDAAKGAEPSSPPAAATEPQDGQEPAAAPSPAETPKQPMLARLKGTLGRAAKLLFDQGMQGATANLADEAQSAIGAGIASAATGEPYSNLYRASQLDANRELERQQHDHPIVSGAAQVAGAIAGPGAAATKLPAVGRGLAALGRVPGGIALQGAAVGAASAPIYAAGAAQEGQRADAAGDAVVPGALVGAVAAPVAGALGNVAANTLGPLSRKAAAYIGRKSQARQIVEKQLTANPDLPNAIRTAENRMAVADREGVPLNLGEALDDNSLRATAAALQGRPETAARMQKFFADRSAAVPGAIDRNIGAIAPNVRTPDQAGGKLIKAAEDKIERMTTKMQSDAHPFYEQAKLETIPEDSPVLKRMTVRQAIAAARKAYPDEIPPLEIPKGPNGEKLPDALIQKLRQSGQLGEGVPDNSIAVLHHAKMQLDVMMKKAVEQGDNTRSKYLGEALGELNAALDKASPAYAQGRQIYQQQMPDIQRLKEGRVGDLTRMRANGPEKATAKLFEGSPTATREMVAALGRPVSQEAAAGELRRIADTNKNDPLTFANKVWGNTPSTAAQEQWRTVLGT
ncbi:hypothetical protein ABIC30_006029, partial [Methylobacterium sp. 1030]